MDNLKNELTENEKKIIKLGKSNDRLNKHCAKFCLPPIIVAIVLVTLCGIGILEKSLFMPIGMCFLLIGSGIPVVWFISLTVKASKIGYTYQRYQELIEKHNEAEDTAEQTETPTAKNSVCESDNEATPEESNQNQERLTDAYIEQFDGDKQKAIKHILYAYEYEELHKYVSEWNKEELQIAYFVMKTEADKNNTKKFVEEYTPCAKKLLIRIIITLFVCAGVIFITQYFKDKVSNFETWNGYATLGLSVFISMQSFKIGSIIVKMVRYRLAKRKLSKYADETEKN